MEKQQGLDTFNKLNGVQVGNVESGLNWRGYEKYSWPREVANKSHELERI